MADESTAEIIESPVGTEAAAEPQAAETPVVDASYEEYKARVTAERNPETAPAGDKQPSKKKSPVTTEAPGPSDKTPVKTAEAAGTSEAQDTPGAKSKRRSVDAETRIQQLTNEIRERDRKIAELSVVPKPAEPKAAPPAVEAPKPETFAKPKPKLAEFLKDGKTYEEATEDWAEAVYDWRDDKKAFETKQKQAEETRVTQQRELGQRVTAVKTKYPDCEDVFKGVNLYNSTLQYATSTEHGLEALYRIGKDPAKLAQIAALPWHQQVREVAAIEAAILAEEVGNRTDPGNTPEKQQPKPQLVSRVPRPISPLGGSDLSEDKPDPAKAKDMGEYRKARVAQGADSRYARSSG